MQQNNFRFTEDDVRDYKRYLMEERELSQVSVSTYLTALRRFCQYLTDIGTLSENPATAVKGNRRPETHSRSVLTESDIEKLEAVVGDATPIDKRDRAIISLMLYAGLSEIEIVRANVEDLEHTLMGPVLRVQGKGREIKDQEAPLDPPVLETVEAYLDTRDDVHPEDPMFVSHGLLQVAVDAAPHRARLEPLPVRAVAVGDKHRVLGVHVVAGVEVRLDGLQDGRIEGSLLILHLASLALHAEHWAHEGVL